MLVGYLQEQFTKSMAKVCCVLLTGGGPSAQKPLEGIKELDASFGLPLSRLGVPLDTMPPKNDPTMANRPQGPLHSSLLPHVTNIVHHTPNPYAAGHGPQLVMGSDGVNVVDLQKHALSKTSETLTEIKALEQSLQWFHMCPMGPDLVATVPHVDLDPMVLEQLPHLYFSGNASAFSTEKTAMGTTLLCIPQFSNTGETVLVNLEMLAVELLWFNDGGS
jgi:DNA polymerase delta subunit 2